MWASEIFAESKTRGSILATLSEKEGSHAVFAERRRKTLTLNTILEYLKSLTAPKMDKDLRVCLRNHPWRARAFLTFLKVHCVGGEVDVRAMEEFYRMQGWLSDYLSDTSDTSVFNDTPNADFYRKLAANQPHLIDWLLQVRALCKVCCNRHDNNTD